MKLSYLFIFLFSKCVQESCQPGRDLTFGQMDDGTLRICVSAEQLWSRSYNAGRWLRSLPCILITNSFAKHSQTVWSTKILFICLIKGIQKMLLHAYGEDCSFLMLGVASKWLRWNWQVHICWIAHLDSLEPLLINFLASWGQQNKQSIITKCWYGESVSEQLPLHTHSRYRGALAFSRSPISGHLNNVYSNIHSPFVICSTVFTS